MGVFANGLEVSGKAVDAKTIAAFPDVCFTPPENPATPPGVPVPYPSFGMAGDTDKGTSTVKIEGKTVNLKNKSYLTKTSGTEAGAAAKKGIITSKNMGKEYFNSWSTDVKFDGEPVIRMSDLATNNHASPTGNTPPWIHAAKINVAQGNCKAILEDAEIKLHTHSEKSGKCPDGFESEHFIQNEYLQYERGSVTAPQFENYTAEGAPCICMQAYTKKADGSFKSGRGSKTGSPHHSKTMHCNNKIKNSTSTPTIGDMADACIEGVVKNHRATRDNPDSPKSKAIGECLRAIFFAHLTEVVNEKRQADPADIEDEPIAFEVNEAEGKMWVWERS